jgi:hypothetical protein
MDWQRNISELLLADVWFPECLKGGKSANSGKEK